MLAKRLAALRKEKALTQEQLARFLGISRSRLSLYEIGKREPDHHTLQKIADFFHVSLDYLLGRVDDPHSQSNAAQNLPKSQEPLAMFDTVLYSIIENAQKLTPKQKEMIAKIIQELVQTTEKKRHAAKK